MNRGIIVDQALLFQLGGELLQIGRRSVGHVADHRQHEHRRKMDRGQIRHLDEIADRFAGDEILDRRRRGRVCCQFHAADVLHEKIERLPHQQRVSLRVLESLRHEQTGRLAHCPANQAHSAAKRAFRQ